MHRHPKFVSALLIACTASLLAASPSTPRALPPGNDPSKKSPSRAAADAAEAYDNLLHGYLHSNFEALPDLILQATRHSSSLSGAQRLNIAYIRAAVAQQRPKWWENTKSPEKVSFDSVIWDRTVVANYSPSKNLGADRALPIVRQGHLVSVITWIPTNVDNPRPADGWLAQKDNLTKGDIGEVIVWHELGHNFITGSISAQDAVNLYQNQPLLYGTLQEFFADLTALYHTSAHARLVTLTARTDLLDPPGGQYNETESHTRAAHAIGAAVLAMVLSEPAKWPHVRLPASVPDTDIELKTIVYMYEHFAPNWSFDEDRALRDWTLTLVRTKGDAIFRSKGMVPLAGKLTFSLMEAQDREMQKKRDHWIAQKLKIAIDVGLADKPEEQLPATKPNDFLDHPRIRLPIY